MENRNPGNTVLFYGKDGDDRPGPRARRSSMLALHLLQPVLVRHHLAVAERPRQPRLDLPATSH